MTRSVLPLILFLPAMLLAGPATSSTESVDGHFELNDDRVEFNHGIAIRWLDPEAPDGRNIVVLLSDVQPDAERGRGKRNPLANIEAGLPFDSPRLQLQVRGPVTAPVIHHLFFGGFMAPSPGGDELEFTNGRLKGSWRVAETPAGPGSRWQADLRFDLRLIDLDASD